MDAVPQLYALIATLSNWLNFRLVLVGQPDSHQGNVRMDGIAHGASKVAGPSKARRPTEIDRPEDLEVKGNGSLAQPPSSLPDPLTSD